MEREMRCTAELIARIYRSAKSKNGSRTQMLKVRKEVEDLVSRFNKIVFGFDSL